MALNFPAHSITLPDDPPIKHHGILILRVMTDYAVYLRLNRYHLLVARPAPISQSMNKPIIIALLLTLLRAPQCVAATPLHELEVEQLMNMEVSTTSRKPQALNQAPAAAFVTTAEDIRRSESSSIAKRYDWPAAWNHGKSARA